MNEGKTHPAMLWGKTEDDKIKCRLCPWQCVIAEGKTGHCRVRANVAGQLVSLNYDRVCSASVDPIEKKPLFHFLPGSTSFSVACVGCNFQCEFCQNWQISQMPYLTSLDDDYPETNPQLIVDRAAAANCKSISYTYTEPTIFFELAYDTSKLAHAAGLKNVFVSNGYITTEALETIEPYLDAINVDLKSFRQDFYHRQCHARLEPVKESLKWLAKSRIWLEVTTLVIPGQNDSPEELKDIAEFIANELGPQVPWHVSRFHGDYKESDLPSTPTTTIESALQIAKEAGLRYTYSGNIPGHDCESTYCYNCNEPLIRRYGYIIEKNKLINGTCPKCQTKIDGIF